MKSKKSRKQKDDSTRVTLRISKECAERIDWLARYNRITQKQVFDKVSRILLYVDKPDPRNQELLEVLKNSIKSESRTDKIRKAQLVSGAAYKGIKSFSSKHSVSRDIMVEKVIDFLCLLAQEDTDKHRTAHEESQKIVDDLWGKLEDAEKAIKRIVGDDDPILKRFGMAIVILMNLSSDIQKELDKGIPVDPEGM